MNKIGRMSEGLSTYRPSTDRCEWKVEAVKQVAYRVVSAPGVFDSSNELLVNEISRGRGSRCLVVIDSNVEEVFGKQVRSYFMSYGVELMIVPIKADETVKQWDAVGRVVDAMNDFRIDRRREPVVAVGGGVLLDIVGFAASVYRRGTPYIRIPTTLIGLVDAGVGVKTGVNFGQGKNRIGTYAPALATFVDRELLISLERRHLSNGIAEILKVALVKSRSLFELIDEYGEALIQDKFQGSTPDLERAANEMISESIHLMLEELQPNLWEACLERCVDYGHTFSPTIEMMALPELLHGEAVCIDMALTTVLAGNRGNVGQDEVDRILAVMQAVDLPIWTEVLSEPGMLDAALEDTIRHRDGQQRLPLPLGVGSHYFANDVTRDEIRDALRDLEMSARQQAIRATAGSVS